MERCHHCNAPYTAQVNACEYCGALAPESVRPRSAPAEVKAQPKPVPEPELPRPVPRARVVRDDRPTELESMIRGDKRRAFIALVPLFFCWALPKDLSVWLLIIPCVVSVYYS